MKSTQNIMDMARSAAGWIMGLGVVLILLGSFAVVASAFTTMISMAILGWILLASGVIQAVQAFWSRQWSGFFGYLLTGIFEFILGILILTYPGLSAVSFTLILAILFLVSGAFRFISALATRYEFWGWHLVAGIAGIALGVMLLAQWPASGIWFIGLLVGVNLIISGWTLFMYSLTCKDKLEEQAKREEPSTFEHRS